MSVRPPRDRVPRPHLVATTNSRRLGDMLQRLVVIAPNDVMAITRLVRDVLKHAEVRHKRYLVRDGVDPTTRMFTP